MTPGTIAAYLVGSRAAILRIAESRWALPVGLALVVSGALARNYDGQDLLAEPWVLLAGVVISTVNALVLFGLVYGVAWLRDSELPPFLSGYRSFLGLFWMTAPMAWLYAVPYERMLEPVEAVKANLATLAFVSVWRVLLSARALSVLFGAPLAAVLTLVLLFSDVTLVAAAVASPKPVIDVMGGLQHSDADALIAGTAFAVIAWGVLLAPVLLIAAFVGGFWVRGSWRARRPERGERAPRGSVALACVALMVFAPALVVTQPEQRLRRRAEVMLRSGDIEGAFAEMSRHGRSAYPPIWDPPPRMGYLETEPDLMEVARAMEEHPPASWVRRIYAQKLARSVLRRVAFGVSSFVEAEQREPRRGGLEAEERWTLGMLMQEDSVFSEEERAAMGRVLRAMAPVESDEGEGGGL